MALAVAASKTAPAAVRSGILPRISDAVLPTIVAAHVPKTAGNNVFIIRLLTVTSKYELIPAIMSASVGAITIQSGIGETPASAAVAAAAFEIKSRTRLSFAA